MPAPPVGTPPAATGLVYHPDYLAHVMPPGHPERPERLAAIVEHLRETGLWDAAAHIEPTPATVGQLARVHRSDYIATVAKTCERGGGLLDMGDTPICRASYDVALLAAGGLLRAADAIVAGTVRSAFCLVRPPGHHARPGNGMGFCVFNNIAIYPGTGTADERGTGNGQGTTANVPLRAGTAGAAFVEAFRDHLEPLAETFRPEFVLVSAGFDGHRDDPLGGMALTEDDYAELARIVRGTADEHCGGRLLLTLEGGYDLRALANSVAAVLRTLLG